MVVKCVKAGTREACRGCIHADRHEPEGAGYRRNAKGLHVRVLCGTWGQCLDDTETPAEVKVRCVRVKEIK